MMIKTWRGTTISWDRVTLTAHHHHHDQHQESTKIPPWTFASTPDCSQLTFLLRIESNWRWRVSFAGDSKDEYNYLGMHWSVRPRCKRIECFRCTQSVVDSYFIDTKEKLNDLHFGRVKQRTFDECTAITTKKSKSIRSWSSRSLLTF